MSDKENNSEHPVDSSNVSPDRSAFKTRLARFAYLKAHDSGRSSLDGDGLNRNDGGGLDGNGRGDRKRKYARAVTSSTTKPARKKARTSAPLIERKAEAEAKSKSPSRPAQPATHRIPNNLVDSLSPNLPLVMCGVNPGLETARTGHAYAHPSNRYWPTMHEAGITPIRHHPSETHSLQQLYGLGHTNIVSHPTRTEAEISRREYLDGAAELETKMRVFRPRAVAIVGKGIWDTWVEYKTGARLNTATGRRRLRELGLPETFEYGWQDERLWIGRTGEVSSESSGGKHEEVDEKAEETESWKGARTIVVTTTSGAAAQFARNGGAERLRIWKPLGDWFAPLREEWIQKRSEREQQYQVELQDGVKVENDGLNEG